MENSVKNELENSVFLDGDWCWDMHPFAVTKEKKRMVVENIVFMLNNFLRCSAYEHVVFCWVMHEQAIIGRVAAKNRHVELRNARSVPRVRRSGAEGENKQRRRKRTARAGRLCTKCGAPAAL